ncbi:MAG: hypothetical protein AAFV53_27070 [Myxococcota bacterium]
MPIAARFGLILSLLSLSTAAQGALPADQPGLSEWWLAAGQIRLGETVYSIGEQSLVFEDGVCSFSLEEGALIPVFSGRAPVSERMIGFAWVGSGDSALRFPDRGDAWRFANHMTGRVGLEADDVSAVADGADYQTVIDRGLILSADPEVLSLLVGLQPIGSGSLVQPGVDGYDEVFVVNERKGAGRVRRIATNMLATRLHALEQSGLHPQAMIRQDRLLHEELSVDGGLLRAVADFRTDTPMRVASNEGAVVGSNNFDRWMTCYRDGVDAQNTGYRSMAFAHGVDHAQRRHFMRLSGEQSAPAGTPERPAPAPVSAETRIAFDTNRRELEQDATVQTAMTIRAEGGPLQHLTLRMPVGAARLGSWELRSLTLSDGTPIRWVGLTAGLSAIQTSGVLSQVQDGASERTIDPATSGNLASGGVNMGMISATNTTSDGGSAVRNSNDSLRGDVASLSGTISPNPALSEQLAFAQTPYRYEVLAVLPEPIPAGQTVTVEMEWSASYRYAWFSMMEQFYIEIDEDMETPVSRALYRPLGATTGAQPLLPEMLPSTPDTWSFTTTAGASQGLVRPRGVVSSGDTTEDYYDARTHWRWMTSEGQARQPVVAVGRWKEISDPPAADLPGVEVRSLSRKMKGSDKQFPPEVRRIARFYQDLLPVLPDEALEVFQTRTQLPLDILTLNSTPSMSGMIEMRTVMASTILVSGEVYDEYPHFSRMQLAQQVASQIWGQSIQPATARDAWMMDALSGAYAALYLYAALGEDAYEEHIAAIQRRLENPVEYSATATMPLPWKKSDVGRPMGITEPLFSDVPQGIRADYGTYVLMEILRPQLGDPIFWGALGGLASARMGTSVRTEDLQKAFEAASGQDLSDFFDYWIHGAKLPELSVSYATSGKGVVGCVTTDAAFGRLMVPVQVGDERLTVPVVNGVGRFSADVSGRARVQVDPDNQLPATRRIANRSATPACGDGLTDANR